MRIRSGVLACLCLSLISLQSTNFAEALVTDRPDFTESTSIIAMKQVQIEGGYTFTSPSAHNYGEGLVRLGIWDKLELRVVVPSYESDSGTSGFADSGLGIKYFLMPASGYMPESALILQGSLPTGTNNLGDKDIQLMSKLCLGWDLPQDISLGSNLNYGWVGSGEDRFYQFSGSITLGKALLENVGGFIEYYGFSSEIKSGSNVQVINGGVTYLLNDQFQMDMRVGKTLTDSSWLMGVGSAVRFNL